MNRLFRFLYILVLPRLPRLGPEDVAGTAEYYNRLARRDEAASNPPDAWMRRIPMRLARFMPQRRNKGGWKIAAQSCRKFWTFRTICQGRFWQKPSASSCSPRY